MSTPPVLWTAEELADAASGKVTRDFSVTGVSIDTRSLKPGDLFVALRDSRDGHEFVADALAKGAAAALVDHRLPGWPEDAPLLEVAESLAGLTMLGAAARARSTARFIGVTGSVGKTTTKEMLRHGLSAIGPTHASAASYNNQWGVPLTLARTPRDAAYAVIEMGMNHRHEIAPLSQLAEPEVAVITTIAPSHIGHLGSLEAIAEEKGDILAGLLPGGTAVFPRDSAFYDRLAERCRAQGAKVVGFGEHPESDARLLEYEGHAEGGAAKIELHGAQFELRLAAPGRHMALNALAALAAGVAAGADPGRFAASLGFFGAGAGRGQRLQIAVPGGTALLIDDSYNGQPTAMRAGLAVLGLQDAKRRIAVLGDMRELGDFGPALHAELAADAAQSADLVFCCGPLMKNLFDALPPEKRAVHLPNSAALAPAVKAVLAPGDAILVKGSLGSRMAVIVNALKEPAA
ncbi:UDP-N-acetylmuramoyl-tripeptide--D-alanyl-D-alanine ligase [Acetobacteraceae bacterium H6797]|nr:UDP-N-acetylmuramoyl-tripeptide--D-alanyl-D-alanine ligase [Acetobacteraceae bacterium H6797]